MGFADGIDRKTIKQLDRWWFSIWGCAGVVMAALAVAGIMAR